MPDLDDDVVHPQRLEGLPGGEAVGDGPVAERGEGQRRRLVGRPVARVGLLHLEARAVADPLPGLVEEARRVGVAEGVEPHPQVAARPGRRGVVGAAEVGLHPRLLGPAHLVPARTLLDQGGAARGLDLVGPRLEDRRDLVVDPARPEVTGRRQGGAQTPFVHDPTGPGDRAGVVVRCRRRGRRRGGRGVDARHGDRLGRRAADAGDQTAPGQERHGGGEGQPPGPGHRASSSATVAPTSCSTASLR